LTEMEIDRSIPTHKSIEWRHLIYLALLAAAVFLLLPHLVRFDRLVKLLLTAHPQYILVALTAESLRYIFSAGSTIALARLFDRRVPLMPMTEAFFAGAALNRIFSTGGAPGMVVRLIFLLKQGLHVGWVAAIYMIEDLIGFGIGVVVFLFGIGILTSAQNTRSIVELALGLLGGSILLGLLVIYVLRQKILVRRLVHGIAHFSNRIVERFFRRTVYRRDRVERTLDDFYVGLHEARLRPQYVAAALLFNVLRYVAGGATLFFCFYALGDTISPGVLILLYTTASVLSTTSAMLGEVAIMGTGFVVLFGTLGLSPEAAILAMVLSRALAFWLPMPVGLLALWHLRRRNQL
jgi:uncharacterized protein (TIRG00374 family)